MSKGSFFAGWSLRPNRPILLLANEQDAKRMTTQLARIGIKDIQGYVAPNEPASQMSRSWVPGILPGTSQESLWNTPNTSLMDVKW